MNDILLYLVFVLILLIAITAYIMIRDKENQAKITQLESSLEDVHKSIHYIKKMLEERNELDESLAQKINASNLDENAIKTLIEKEISNKILPILKSLKGFESVIGELQSEQENRLSSLEQKTQSFTKLSPDYSSEEQKIIDLFKAGKSIEQIAKDLRISTGNVEFALKFNKAIE